MGHPVVHFEVIGRDGEKLRSYYSELFGWHLEQVPGPMDYWTVSPEGDADAGAAGIGGGIGGYEDTPHQVTFYVEVPDIEAALAKAASLGGEHVRGPDEVPGAGIAIAHFADPGEANGVT